MVLSPSLPNWTAGFWGPPLSFPFYLAMLKLAQASCFYSRLLSLANTSSLEVGQEGEKTVITELRGALPGRGIPLNRGPCGKREAGPGRPSQQPEPCGPILGPSIPHRGGQEACSPVEVFGGLGPCPWLIQHLDGPTVGGRERWELSS